MNTDTNKLLKEWRRKQMREEILAYAITLCCILLLLVSIVTLGYLAWGW